MRRMPSNQKALKSIRVRDREVTINDAITAKDNGDVEVGRNLEVDGNLHTNGFIETLTHREERKNAFPSSQHITINKGTVYVDFTEKSSDLIARVNLKNLSNGDIDLHIIPINTIRNSTNNSDNGIIIDSLNTDCAFDVRYDAISDIEPIDFTPIVGYIGYANGEFKIQELRLDAFVTDSIDIHIKGTIQQAIIDEETKATIKAYITVSSSPTTMYTGGSTSPSSSNAIIAQLSN